MNNIDNVKIQYSEWAKTYERDKIELFERDGVDYEEFMNKFLEFCELKPNFKILDIGIGTGLTSIFLAQKLDNKCYIIGIEPSEEMIKIAENNLKDKNIDKEIIVQKGRGEELPFNEAFFDLVVSTFAIRHMNIEQVLKEIKKVLKHYGKVVIADICAPEKWRSGFGKCISIISKYIIIRKTKYKSESKSCVLTVKEWEELFSKLGFKIERIKEFLNKNAPEWKPKRVIFSLKKG